MTFLEYVNYQEMKLPKFKFETKVINLSAVRAQIECFSGPEVLFGGPELTHYELKFPRFDLFVFLSLQSLYLFTNWSQKPCLEQLFKIFKNRIKINIKDVAPKPVPLLD
jgi:hypothetical protein